jgi:hypothetical protein
MGRKKKPLDLVLVAKLHADGLTVRAIAERLGNVSYSTVFKQLENKKTRIKKQEIKKQDKKTSHLVDGKSCKNPVPSFASSTKQTPPPLALPQLEAHHSQYSVRYAGKQPVSLVSFRPLHNIVYEFDKDGVHMLAYGGKDKDHALVGWVNDAEGKTTDEIEGKTRARAWLAMRQLAAEQGLTLDRTTFAAKSEPHFTLKDDEFNALLLAVLRENPSKALKMGIKAGDSSHRDQPEFVPKEGKRSVDTLLEMITEWPDAKEATFAALETSKTAITLVGEQARMQERYNANIEKHLATLGRIGDSLDKFDKRMDRLEKILRRKRG